MKPRILVITGPIGSGKSSALKLLASKGLPVYSADDYSRDLYRGPILDRVQAAFPGLVKEGHLDRKALRDIIAKDEGARLRLNAISHPEILKRMAEAIKDPVAVVEIPLYSEVAEELNAHFDIRAVAYIGADPETRILRVMDRDGVTETQARAIIRAQVYDDLNRDLADFIIKNNEGMGALERQLGPVIEVLNESN